MTTFQNYLQSIKSEISEMDTTDLAKHLADNPDTLLIDVREENEYAQGFIKGALWISRGFLEIKIEEAVSNRDTEIVIYCAGGTRSALAVKSLAEMGYKRLYSLKGGFGAWKRNGYDFDVPTLLTPDQAIRYSRHTMLPEIGVDGQVKLLNSRVLCIGAGGLGSPSALYLAAAGVGTIGIIDDDVVDSSNLQRQILHNSDRIGMPKVESAALTLQGLNPDVRVIPHQLRLNSENAEEILKNYDLVVDGADNFQTRYLLNDLALKLGIPVVHSSIYRFEGQLTVFSNEGLPCYRCLYPEPPPPDQAPSCAEAGVLGVLPGVMGVMQATEAVKILLGLGTSLAGRLLTYDALGSKFRELKLRPDPNCKYCAPGVDKSKIELIDYTQFCMMG
ncbi:MAG: molybdopterin-synthase adenylyltransferase MoeB [Kofleriaceae bacterium]|nr:molybdopterin-synthase adenylyltransferase MoeB [Kofleriaceae bacterium]